MAFIPVPGTSVSSIGHSYPYLELTRHVSSVHPWRDTRGMGMPLQKYPGAGTYGYRVRVQLVYLPGTSVISMRLPYPYPELLWVRGLCSLGYVQDHTPGITRTRNSCKFCTAFIPVPGSYVSSVHPWRDTRGMGMPLQKYPGAGTYGYRVRVQHPCTHPGLCDFYKTSIPVPGTSVGDRVVLFRVRTEPHRGYYRYPELL